jgi:2-oxoisovalerate dehydrogenase E1 component
LDKENLIEMYRMMYLIRKFEEAAVQINRTTNEISGVLMTCDGQEAVPVGVSLNLRKGDFSFGTHRPDGHIIARGADIRKVMAEMLARETGYCKGRAGPMHIQAMDVGFMTATGIVGDAIPISAGVGLSSKLRGTDQVAVPFFGDGATNTGAFHEGVNLAALWRLPVVFVCENNLYAVSTGISRSAPVENVADRASAYGIPSKIIDGMDVVEVYKNSKEAVERARRGEGPTLLECKTFRFVGHSAMDPAPFSYMQDQELEKWKKRDPIQIHKKRLLDMQLLSEEELHSIEKKVEREVEEAKDYAMKSPKPPVSILENHLSAYEGGEEVRPSRSGGKEQVLQEVVRDALYEEMLREDRVFVLGEDIGAYGGLYGCTKGLYEKFGDRVRDTPISECGIVGAAIGAAASGMRPVAEIMFNDFLPCGGGMEQTVNQLAKLPYCGYGQIKLPVVIRMNCGSRNPIISIGPHHHQSFESWFMHVPGLQVVAPSTPYDAKGLLKSSIRNDDPVLFFEHKLLYYGRHKSMSMYHGLISTIPEDDYTIPVGKADIKRKGDDVTVIATMMMVHKSLRAAEKLSEKGVDVEVVDPRTLAPLDRQTILESVKKTGRAVIVSEDCKTGGVAAEISSIIMEEAFDHLDASVRRVCSKDIVIPYGIDLERAFLPQEEDIIKAIQAVMY